MSMVELMPRLGLMYSDCTSLAENWMSLAITCHKYNIIPCFLIIFDSVEDEVRHLS